MQFRVPVPEEYIDAVVDASTSLDEANRMLVQDDEVRAGVESEIRSRISELRKRSAGEEGRSKAATNGHITRKQRELGVLAAERQKQVEEIESHDQGRIGLGLQVLESIADNGDIENIRSFNEIEEYQGPEWDRLKEIAADDPAAITIFFHIIAKLERHKELAAEHRALVEERRGPNSDMAVCQRTWWRIQEIKPLRLDAEMFVTQAEIDFLVDIGFKDLSGGRFAKLDMRRIVAEDVDLSGADIIGCNLNDTGFDPESHDGFFNAPPAYDIPGQKVA